MKKLSLQQMIAAGAGATVVVIGGAYFGLSTYAGSLAEDKIRSTLSRAGINDSSYSWSSLSASPLGGSIKLEGLKVNHDTSNGRGRRFIAINIEELVLEGFNGEEFPEEATISLGQVDVPSISNEGYERNELKKQLDQSQLMTLANASGRQSLLPFDVKLDWELGDDELELNWSTTQPEMFKAEGHQLITGPISQLQAMTTPASLSATSPMSLLAQYAQLGSQLGIRELDLTIEDLGSMERATKLRTRYDIARGQAENEDESQEEFMADFQSDCEQNLQAIFENSDACENLTGFMTAENSSIEFSAEGARSLTLAELVRLNPRNFGYLKTEFHPEIN
ncbi:hypothetical protein [Marinobacterium mangrovicola]|uniref:Uncharacterized protein n=1 Tax=Marinobacterium mangrovicola TaxID=1476959 RepID=A0A4R1G915_9GAMM|nr:hypothetical protein [Marinobacterium mangrovicola]TCK04128.1 hypothetical protein CLV83_3543 [Marinobacterium mangrovicola]